MYAYVCVPSNHLLVGNTIGQLFACNLATKAIRELLAPSPKVDAAARRVFQVTQLVEDEATRNATELAAAGVDAQDSINSLGMRFHPTAPAHPTKITSITWSNAGDMWLTGDACGIITLWQPVEGLDFADTAAPVPVPNRWVAHRGAVHSLVFADEVRDLWARVSQCGVVWCGVAWRGVVPCGIEAVFRDCQLGGGVHCIAVVCVCVCVCVTMMAAMSCLMTECP